jgi:peptide/nickel transport system substrate-binding protein
LKEIYIDGELEPVDTVQWYPKVMRGDYAVGLNLTGNGLDDPDQTLYENFTCGAEGNYDRYCNPELDKMVDLQSMEFDQKKRKELVWRSSGSWRKTRPGRSSGTTVPGPVGSPM